MARFWRYLHLGRNPLARPGDRFEARLLLCCLLLAVVAIPIAATIGSEAYASRLADVERDAGSKYRTTATLLDRAPLTMSVGEVETAQVKARWTLPDGSKRVGEVNTYRGTAKGSEVSVWLDSHGNPTSPPATHASAATDGVSAGISSWLAVALTCGLLLVAVRGLLNRFRSTQWARDWAYVEREWSRR